MNAKPTTNSLIELLSLGYELHPVHPDGGWPEFTLTLKFYVPSDDPKTLERAAKYAQHIASDRLDSFDISEAEGYDGP